MSRWQQWVVRHPFTFFFTLFLLTAILGISLTAGPVFYAAALVSGAFWFGRSSWRESVGQKQAAGARITQSRRRRALSALPPVNLPSVAHVLLPRGQKIQVTKEEQHPDNVGALLDGDHGRHVAATLHRMPPATSRSTKERVQVRINDVPVGELTPYMSEHFLPLIGVCEDRGVVVACAAVVKGNVLKADVVLDTVKAIDLDHGWIEEHILGEGTA